MFAARSAFRTTMSETIFEVVEIMAGRVVLARR